MSNDDWVYCGDGKNMPPKEGFYLISISDKVTKEEGLKVTKCFFSESFNAFMPYEGLVDAWMPLPKSYCGSR